MVEHVNSLYSTDGFWPADVQVGTVIYPPGGKFGPRHQSNLQLVMLHSGSMTVWIDGLAHHAQEQSVSLLFPGHQESFAFAAERETSHSWAHILIAHPHQHLLERLKALPWSLPLSPAMNQLTQEALWIQATPFPTAVELLKTLAIQMIWRYIGEGELRASRIAIPFHPAVEQAQQFIHEHLSEPITLATIAAAVALSPSHLIRLFQSQLKTTPIAYLWERRVARGVELLEQTGLPIAIVAQRSGFQSRYHFSRRIQQALGYTPLEIRQRSWQQLQ